MVDAVLLFAALSALFEFVIVMKVPARIRLRVLGNGVSIFLIHSAALLINLIVHWGTITGTMSAVIAGLASMATVPLARKLSGHIVGTLYYPGVIKYDPATLI